MVLDLDALQQKLQLLEQQMSDSEFWLNKDTATRVVAEYQKIKSIIEQGEDDGYNNHNAIVRILAGAGGDDSEDFVRMLLGMYESFAKKNDLLVSVVDSNPNNSSGYRSVSLVITGPRAYQHLKFESGVHRLIRISPFNSLGKRQTSFAMVEVLPEILHDDEVKILKDDVVVEFARSSGPGGQNVNKRETMVRITHIPTGLTAYADNNRTQEANREAAMVLLRGKIAARNELEHHNELSELKISETVENEWGSQIRTYTLHPYQLVKDHRTNIEIHNVESVLLDGNINMLTKPLYD